jgi:hypothetical protein
MVRQDVTDQNFSDHYVCNNAGISKCIQERISNYLALIKEKITRLYQVNRAFIWHML